MDWNMDVNVDVDLDVDWDGGRRWRQRQRWRRRRDRRPKQLAQTTSEVVWAKTGGIRGRGWVWRKGFRQGGCKDMQPASQTASQPGHSKGHDGGLECGRGTGHVAGSQRSLAVASPSCDPWTVHPAPSPPTQPHLPFSAELLPFHSFSFPPPLTLGHCLKCLPKWSSRGGINFQSYSWAVLSAYNFLIHFPRLRRSLFEDNAVIDNVV